MDIGDKFEKQTAQDPFEEIKELKNLFEENNIKDLTIKETKQEEAPVNASSGVFSVEEVKEMKSLLSKNFLNLELELGLDIPTADGKIDLSSWSEHVYPHYKGKKTQYDYYAVSALNLGIGWGYNRVFIQIYEYLNYDGYKMVSIGLNDHYNNRHHKLEGENKKAFIPFCLLVNGIVRKRIYNARLKKKE